MRLLAWLVVLILIGIMCYRRYREGKLMGVFLAILAIVAAVYIGLSVMLFLMQSRILYQPMRGYDYNPADHGLAYEPVSLATPDGQTLAGWYVPAAGDGRTVLFCHGNAGNISQGT